MLTLQSTHWTVVEGKEAVEHGIEVVICRKLNASYKQSSTQIESQFWQGWG